MDGDVFGDKEEGLSVMSPELVGALLSHMVLQKRLKGFPQERSRKQSE